MPYKYSDFDFAVDRERPEKRIERRISEEIDQRDYNSNPFQRDF